MGGRTGDDHLEAVRGLDRVWSQLDALVVSCARASRVTEADEDRYSELLGQAQVLHGRLSNLLGVVIMEQFGRRFDAFQFVLAQPSLSQILGGAAPKLGFWKELWALAASAIRQAVGRLEAEGKTDVERRPDDGLPDQPAAVRPAAKGNMLVADARGRLQEQMDRLEELAAAGRNPTLEELQEWAMWADTVVRHVYGEESPQTRDFGGVMSGPWPGPTVPSVRGYVQRLPKWRGLLSTWIREIDEFGTAGKVAEQYIPPRSQFDAYVLLKDTVEAAVSSVTLVDPYTDDATIQVLKAVSPDVHVRVLTVNPARDFAHVLKLFRQQWGGNIEARQGPKELHDRFLLVDDRVFFSGASFKDLGQRGSMIDEIRTEAVREAVKKDIEAWWAAAQPIA